jgi:hypothetical protein
MYHKKKKTKYNNGGLVARKEFKGIGSIEGNIAGNQNYMRSSVAASVRKGGTAVTGSISKDSMGNKTTNYSLEKQLPGKSSVNVNKNSISYSKGIGKGFTVKAQFNKKGSKSIPFGYNQGTSKPFKNEVVMSISKPL